VFSFGLNSDGQLGTGDAFQSGVNTATPQRICLAAADDAAAGDSDGDDVTPTLVRAGHRHSILVCRRRSGATVVFSYGRDADGLLGRRCCAVVPHWLPGVVSFNDSDGDNDSGDGIVDVQCGACHCLALTRSGDVYAWGLGQWGALAAGDAATAAVPARVHALSGVGGGVVAVAAGWSHSVFLCADGSVYTSGRNSSLQCGVGVGVAGDELVDNAATSPSALSSVPSALSSAASTTTTTADFTADVPLIAAYVRLTRPRDATANAPTAAPAATATAAPAFYSPQLVDMPYDDDDDDDGGDGGGGSGGGGGGGSGGDRAMGVAAGARHTLVSTQRGHVYGFGMAPAFRFDDSAATCSGDATADADGGTGGNAASVRSVAQAFDAFSLPRRVHVDQALNTTGGAPHTSASVQLECGMWHSIAALRCRKKKT
jgi:alpha-tubulin suppressor-like RCC1 family protein